MIENNNSGKIPAVSEPNQKIFITNKSKFPIFLVVFSFIVGFVICLLKPWNMLSPNSVNTLSIVTIQSIVEKGSDLITTKYKYKDVDIYSDAKKFINTEIPFTKDTIVFTYEGEIGLGVDLSDVEYQVDNGKKEISITIPEIVIKVNTIDLHSFKYLLKENSIFNPLDMNNYTNILQSLEDEHGKAALEDENLMGETKTNTETVIENFLKSADTTKNYNVIFTN